MHKIILIVIALTYSLTASGQNLKDTIEIRKPLGTVFFQHGKKLSPRQIMEITKSNVEAYKEIKVARTNLTFANIFGVAGGFLVGWPLGAAVAGGDPNWTLAAIGGGLIIVSVPFSISYTKHTKIAVGIYNEGLRQTSSYDIKFSPVFTSNGMGIMMNF